MIDLNKEPCFRCHGKLKEGKTTQTYDYHDSLLVVREIPAYVCEQCGEALFTNDIVKSLERITRQFKEGHKGIEITRYDDVA